MSSPFSRSFGASGNIAPMSVVMYDTANDGKCLQAGAGSTGLVGITAEWTRWPPLAGTSLDDGLNAIASEGVMVYLPGYKGCKIQLDPNSGSVTPGTRLKPSATGLLTPVTTDKDEYICVASINGIGNQIINADVEHGYYRA